MEQSVKSKLILLGVNTWICKHTSRFISQASAIYVSIYEEEGNQKGKTSSPACSLGRGAWKIGVSMWLQSWADGLECCPGQLFTVCVFGSLRWFLRL